ncbi:hypothetical protein ACQ4PT_070507 [Festuca glaucescens]
MEKARTRSLAEARMRGSSWADGGGRQNAEAGEQVVGADTWRRTTLVRNVLVAAPVAEWRSVVYVAARLEQSNIARICDKDSDGKNKDSDSAENNFESWLTKEKGNLRVKACSAAKELPDGSDWNWEFEDEFQRYLPAYMEMLQQVDSIDACELVFDCSSAIISRLQEIFEINFEDPDCAVLPSLDLLDGLLSIWEPVYHPLIRESHMNILLRKVHQYIKANEREHCQQVVPATLDFEVHLQPYADTFFENTLKENMVRN